MASNARLVVAVMGHLGGKAISLTDAAEEDGDESAKSQGEGGSEQP
jgi:hypothetical protein